MNNENNLKEVNPTIEVLCKKEKPVSEYLKEIVENNKKMSPMEVEELSNRIKGLSREEMDIVADNIPNEVLILSLTKRMCRYEGIEMSLNNLIKRLSGQLL